jgi:hypothetical protein
MGLEFLSDHGASRVRPYPDQPELDQPGEAEESEGEPGDEQVDHAYEFEGRPWQPITVDRAEVDWDEAPRRFVDGCHVGHTIAWLRDVQGHPVPLMLAEIGGVCMDRDGRDLRRSFQVVERVVAMAIDPFPWHEVEDFAIALAGTGFRLLPVSLRRNRSRVVSDLLTVPGPNVDGEEEPEGEGAKVWSASFDFEVMRKKAQNRSNAEMEVLEEVALCQNAEIPTVVDGRLEPRINSDERLQCCPIVGVIKQQRKGYLHPDGWRSYYNLEPAQRTPAFLIRSESVPVVSWYLKLDGARGTLPNWGVVRVEIAEAYFERIGRDFRQVDRLSLALFQMRCRLAAYRRGPVSLEPIVRAEESLRALFSPPTWLAQHFYRLTRL